MHNYNPVIARNIPQELSDLQRERGYALTKADFKAEGFSDEQLSDANIARAAETYARDIQRRAA